MNRNPLPEDENWESDSVWKLLDEAPPVSARPRFADNVMRAVRLDEAPAPWWKRWALPVSVGGLVAATAAIVLTVQAVVSHPPAAKPGPVANNAPAAESFDAVQDITDSEVLVAAADHLDRYSDTELVSLISF
ncbi:hypothetical protein KBB96_20580 [Luteolibacter ambystomatis]|uniref:Uncharacterized protein n=1 Tax=Luteolibacter ambystomatis TaxID=2824561 RepID=A0A975G8E4_9BACT|nr:hypothetical protein [Luteolibacter ambystomatis]QUE51237.1 hypothetical protein KBB96_20580 [Luteolibacter ambystomatis]